MAEEAVNDSIHVPMDEHADTTKDIVLCDNAKDFFAAENTLYRVSRKYMRECKILYHYAPKDEYNRTMGKDAHVKKESSDVKRVLTDDTNELYCIHSGGVDGYDTVSSLCKRFIDYCSENRSFPVAFVKVLNDALLGDLRDHPEGYISPLMPYVLRFSEDAAVRFLGPDEQTDGYILPFDRMKLEAAISKHGFVDVSTLCLLPCLYIADDVVACRRLFGLIVDNLKDAVERFMEDAVERFKLMQTIFAILTLIKSADVESQKEWRMLLLKDYYGGQMILKEASRIKWISGCPAHLLGGEMIYVCNGN